MPAKGYSAAFRNYQANRVLLALRRSASAGPTSHTTFLEALGVPDLVLACARALESRRHMDRPGSGIHKLRLTSKGVRAAVEVAGAVQAYTLKLGEAFGLYKAMPDDLKLAAFLNSSGLLRLRVAVPPLPPTETDQLENASMGVATPRWLWVGTDLGWNQFSLLQPPSSARLLPTPALPSVVSRLSHSSSLQQQAHLKSKTVIEDAIAAVLSPLAAACPQLQQLTVTGPISAEFLQKLGSSCKKLNSMQANLTHLSAPTLRKLGELLPNLTSLAALSPPQLYYVFTAHRWPSNGNSMEYADAISTVLKACPSLLSFDSGSIEMTRDIWQALPTGLHTLACSLSSHLMDNNWEQHASLQRLNIRSTVFKVGLTQVGLLLEASPGVVAVCLQKSSMDRLCVTYSRADARYLQVLNARLSMGLELLFGSNREVDSSGRCSMQLSFEDDYTRRDISDPSSDHFPLLLPAFIEILLQGSLSQYTSLNFEVGMEKALASNSSSDNHGRSGNSGCSSTSSCRNDSPTGDLSYLPKLFPNLTHLKVAYMCMNTADLQALADCILLKSLLFQTVNGLSTAELRLVVLRCKLLEDLSVWDCAGVAAKDRWTIRGKGKRSPADLWVVIDGKDTM